MSEGKIKKAVSIRFDPVEYANYASMVEYAGIPVSDGLRLLVAQKVAEAVNTDMSGFSVSCQFKWKTVDRAFPEHVANVLVEVTPPEAISVEMLQRFVFVLPEFWRDDGYEHFRVDSAYFHRVTSTGYFKDSSKASRNVTSFHLINSSWRGAVYDYGSGFSKADIESQIREELTAHVTETLRCYLIGHLPDSRVLPEDLHQDMISVFDPAQLAKMMSL
ncbi:hypothetical protein NLO83_25345 [Pseudomonas tremae]|uniref:hypothetical protein n=1 Tax=Pseudomonas syringae group TaxID=136849 RepID=UPI0001AF601A|nr:MULTISPECIES: hypothetical protein [Pseudomonas syringae group]MCQ3018896.1 hypothetical protein [Pseudomonas tremae]QGL57416.1 hypothetical protein POR16_14250 [Pseudomonas coronafaciens pv. oryzae str. 1_6]RMM31857.1 hypothetical protein ALQ80_02066 [Pseudomonas coronafaciens pv. oryzae]